MSHFVRVKNNRVVGQQKGIAPTGSDWVHVKRKWAYPGDYPDDFYFPTSTKPRLDIVGDEVHETWSFELKNTDSIKAMFYEEHRIARYALQIGSFVYKNKDILIGDIQTSFIIAGLPEVETNYKLGSDDWLVLSAADVVDFKQAHRNHVQGAFDWEKSENEAISALSIDELMALRNK